MDRSGRFKQGGAKRVELKYAVVMEAGVESLASWAAANKNSGDAWRAIGAAVVRAVDVLSRRNIVHTDIKLDNIFRFNDGSWRFIDFDGSGRIGDQVLQFGTLK